MVEGTQQMVAKVCLSQFALAFSHTDVTHRIRSISLHKSNPKSLCNRRWLIFITKSFKQICFITTLTLTSWETLMLNGS